MAPHRAGSIGSITSIAPTIASAGICATSARPRQRVLPGPRNRRATPRRRSPNRALRQRSRLRPCNQCRAPHYRNRLRMRPHLRRPQPADPVHLAPRAARRPLAQRPSTFRPPCRLSPQQRREQGRRGAILRRHPQRLLSRHRSRHLPPSPIRPCAAHRSESAPSQRTRRRRMRPRRFWTKRRACQLPRTFW